MGTLVCRITLNKNENQGITVYVENGEQITQTIQMNGSNIQVIHKEGSATQKITLDGSSIVAQSTQEGNTSTITQNFGDINISCNSLTVNAKEKISLSGGTSVSIEGETTSITGETKLEAQGGEATLKADTSLSLQGLNTTVKGTNLDLEGEAESNLKSSALVNIQGTLIKIGQVILMKNEMQEAFRQEMKAIRDFFAIYKKSQPDLADIKEEDPDVQRLIETMAFFTAHTQVSSAKNIKNTEKRLWQEFFPFLFSPLPAMSILEAEVQIPNFKLATTLPKGAKVAVQMMESNAALNAKPKVANFYTSRDLKISPVLLKRIENYQQKNKFVLIMNSRYQQSGAIDNLNLYVNYLDDYAKSLHLLLSIQDHLQKVEIVFEDQKQPLPCIVSFGLDSDPQDLASDYFEHPLYKARLFLHFPQQDLYINIFPDKRYTNLIPQTWSEYSIVFTFDEEWKSLDSLNELLDFQPFSVNTVPMVNLSRDSSAVIHFDGTQIRQPIYSTQPGFALQRIKGVYKIVDGLNVAIRPGFIRDDSESYEFEYFKNLAWLIYYSGDMYTQPTQLVVDGFWYQPWITNYLQKKITVSLYDRNINYVKWKLVLPIEPSTPSLLVDEPNQVLYLIFWQKKFFLNAEQQLSFLKSLPDIKKSVFHEIPDLITSLNIESCNTLYRQKIMYYIYFDQLTSTQLDLSKAFFRTLVLAMNAYTNSDLEFYIKVIQDKTSDYYITGKGKIHSGSKKEQELLELLWYQVIIVFNSMEQWQAKILAENKPDELQSLLQELQSDMTSQLNDLNTLFIEQIGELNASYSLFPIVVYFDEIIQTTLSIEYISYWQQNFQKQYFRTDIGGDLFYERLDEILSKRNIDIFVYSVFYFCLNDGFKGRYVNNPQEIADYKKQIAAIVPAVEVQPYNDSPPTELRTLEQINFASYIWNALLIVLCIYVVYYFFHGN